MPGTCRLRSWRGLVEGRNGGERPIEQRAPQLARREGEAIALCFTMAALTSARGDGAAAAAARTCAVLPLLTTRACVPIHWNRRQANAISDRRNLHEDHRAYTSMLFASPPALWLRATAQNLSVSVQPQPDAGAPRSRLNQARLWVQYLPFSPTFYYFAPTTKAHTLGGKSGRKELSSFQQTS